MTADKMPLLLDTAMPVDLNSVDDLFGDDVHLQLPVASQGKQLNLRLDELRNRGCCRSLAWSKAGTIASLTQDGQTLEFRFLRCDASDGTWALSEPTVCELVKGTPATPLVHLEWGATNNPELAVLDSAGRVAILSFAISTNSPSIGRRWEADIIDDFTAVAGCYWLPIATSYQDKPFHLVYGPAKKMGNSYSYEKSFVQAHGPYHPHPAKSVLFCLTAGGLLKMYWSQNNNRLEETTVELESVNTSDERVTHAAFTSDKNYLLAAIATASRQLKLLRIEIQWGGPGSSSEKGMPQNARLNPALVETHVAAAAWFGPGASDANDILTPKLSLVQVLPSLVDNTGSLNEPPLILTVRSRVSGEGGFQSPQSIIDRWQAVDAKSNLESAFERLGNRRNSISLESNSGTRLKKLETIFIHKIVIGLQVLHFGKTICLAMSDGTVEYRDRVTFEEINLNQDMNRLMMLRQAGWSFPDDGPCQQTVISPTHCSMTQIGDDGKVRWTKLQFSGDEIGNSAQDAPYIATTAVLALTAAGAMWQQNNYDDVLAIAQPLASKKRFVMDWISEIIRILNMQVDYSEETHHDTLMRNAPLQHCLGILGSLGFRGEFRKRSFQSKFAMLSLNMRNVVILITLASNTPMTLREKISPLDEPEVVEALAGCVQWSIDLLAWLADCLFELMVDEEFQKRTVPQRFSELNPYLLERNDVSVHLLFSSVSRSFLSAVCRRVELLGTMSNKAMEFYKTQASADAQGTGRVVNPQLQQAYHKIQKATSTSLIKVQEFEHMLNFLAKDIKQTYTTLIPQMIKTQPNAPQGKQKLEAVIKSTQTQFEIGMLLSSSPPPIFMPVIRKFFSKDLVAFRNLTDPLKLFFADYELLEVLDDDDSLAARRRKKVHVDMFKKVKLRRGGNAARWRRCVRCASVMEDANSARPGFAFVLSQQRKCCCGAYWSLLPQGELVL